jgi:hypothetical protein
MVALGFSDAKGESTQLYASVFESYLAALALTEMADPREPARATFQRS